MILARATEPLFCLYRLPYFDIIFLFLDLLRQSTQLRITHHTDKKCGQKIFTKQGEQNEKIEASWDTDSTKEQFGQKNASWKIIVGARYGQNLGGSLSCIRSISLHSFMT